MLTIWASSEILSNVIWNLSSSTRSIKFKKRHRSTGRTVQLRSNVNQSVQPLNQSPSTQPYQTNPLSIVGSIAEQPTKVLINSGASLTLINSNLFYQLPYHIRQGARYPPSNLQVHLADKSRVHVEKTLLLPITIANRTRKHLVYVVPKLWRPCIIGNDFIQKHNLHVDGGQQKVYFKDPDANNSRKLNLNASPEESEQHVLLANERIKIPPYHATDLQVRSNKEVINPNGELSEYEITSLKHTPCVANGIIKPQTLMHVLVANLTKKTIIIHPGEALAKMTRLNQEQLNVIHRTETTLQEEKVAIMTTEAEPDLLKKI